MQTSRRSLLTLLGLLAIKTYRNILSPLMLSVCRFTPSCSEYAEESLRRHGFFKGCWHTAFRLGRCHPFSPPGADPVK